MTIKHFHSGELRLQQQVGKREHIDKLSQRLMLDYMTDEHREFFMELEYIFLGAVDNNGQPHACIVTGPTRFVSSPDPQTLIINTGDRGQNPAFNALGLAQPVGILGIDLSNRRRNRMHGRISALDESSITITVVQSYGNCPKYISLREVSERGVSSIQDIVSNNSELDAKATALIKAADTFFIASYVSDGSGAPYEGVDVNHRGGKPGFVSIDSPTLLTIPDYKGNNLFNTFGNLLLNPQAGVLFIDFQTGDQLHIHARATLIESEDVISRYPGAQRLLQLQIDSVSQKVSATPLRWRFVDASPFSPDVTSS